MVAWYDAAMSGIFATMFAREQRNTISLTDPIDKWRSVGLAIPTAAGISVSSETALRASAVYACVRILGETLASLPLFTYERKRDGSKRRATDFYLYRLLHDQPNPEMTAFEFRETAQAHLALWGNAYAEIEIDGRGRVTALWLLRPDKMRKIERTRSGQLIYHYELPTGGVEPIPNWAIWHLRGMGSDGIIGYNPIQLMREGIALGLGAEEFGARLFGNGAVPGGVLEYPGVLDDDAYDRLVESWNRRHQGLGNANRMAILEEGLTYKAIGIPPETAQFLETRKFQVTEIARAFRIPPHMVADLDRSTNNNIEHQSIEFVTHTIRPWLVRWEQSINSRLMSAREQSRYFAEFQVDGLLRGDIASRYTAYATGRQWGWLSANDIRQLENMNPIDGGDAYLTPLNMLPNDTRDQNAKQ